MEKPVNLNPLADGSQLSRRMLSEGAPDPDEYPLSVQQDPATTDTTLVNEPRLEHSDSKHQDAWETPRIQEPQLEHSDSKHQDAWETPRIQEPQLEHSDSKHQDAWETPRIQEPQLEHSDSKHQDAWETPRIQEPQLEHSDSKHQDAWETPRIQEPQLEHSDIVSCAGEEEGPAASIDTNPTAKPSVGEWQPPSRAEAAARAKALRCPTFLEKIRGNSVLEESADRSRSASCLWWTTPHDSLSVLGPGIAMHFKMLHVLAKTFCTLTIFSAVTLAACLVAATSSGDVWRTVKGVEMASFESIILKDNFDTFAGEDTLECCGLGVQTKDMMKVISWCDVLCMVIFGFALMYLRRLKVLLEGCIDAANITLADFSILVKNLPEDLADEQELKDHFGFQYGKVAEVVLVKEKGSLTDMEMHLEALQEKLMEANARVAKSQGKVGMKRRQKAEENVQKMADKIAQSRQVLRHRCTCAFVTFDDEQCRVQVLEDLPPGWGLPYLISLVLTPPEKRFRGERVLMATQAAEPSDVIWENLQHNRFDLLARRALSLSAMAVMLLICAGLVVVVDNIVSPHIPTEILRLAAAMLAVGILAFAANENELHVNCGSTEAGYENYGLGLGLPCDAMWPLDTTTSNDDPARVSIDAFREQVRLSTCNEHLYFGVYQWTDEVDAASRFNYTEYTGESEGWAGGLYPDSNADECAGEVCYACYCQ
eukprot:gene4442-5452_t